MSNVTFLVTLVNNLEKKENSIKLLREYIRLIMSLVFYIQCYILIKLLRLSSLLLVLFNTPFVILLTIMDN